MSVNDQSMPVSDQIAVRLTPKQRAVLRHIESQVAYRHRPVVEQDIWASLHREDPVVWNGFALHGHLKALIEKGLVERSGVRGGYEHELTALGKQVDAAMPMPMVVARTVTV